jgi:hypothetical protein
MRPLLFLLFIARAAFPADEILALALRAQTDFDRVELSPTPALPETLACVQSQAMMLPVARPAEMSLVYYRKGYCELLGAAITAGRAEYRGAARDFEKAIEAWPQRARHGTTVPPVSPGLRVLADAAHLLADGNTDPRVSHDLDEAVVHPDCAAVDMSQAKCEALVEIGKLWLGWIAFREGRLSDAARWFTAFSETGWPSLPVGSQAMAERKFPLAAAAFRLAVEKFTRRPQSGLAAIIGPRPDLADAELRLGMAQFGARNFAAAAAGFDEVVKLRPENARAIFLRGRAREMLGESGLNDFDLASRVAFANVNGPGAGGQAHLYRGVSLYRRKDYARAEQEFSSALNFDAGPARQDAAAWRHMAAVAAGACGPSAALLQQSLPGVSDYFPKAEAEALLKNCAAPSISEVLKPTAR